MGSLFLRRTSIAAAVVLVLGLCQAVLAATVTVTFQEGVDGYNATVDTYIHESKPQVSFGSQTSVHWDTLSSGGEKVALIRFENLFGSGPGQIPVGAAIHSATLTYEVFNKGQPADVHEVLIDWPEDVTYNSFGGDVGIQVGEYGTWVGTATGSRTGVYSIDVTASVAVWANNPTANRGWIFLPTGNNGVDIVSSEDSVVADRPKLMVVYSLTPTAPTPDTTVPTVSIMSPTSGTTYASAQTVTIMASASDNMGVTRVEFYDGATLKHTDFTNSYTYNWSVSSAENGGHMWTAKAYDAAGNSTVSSTALLTVNISDTLPGDPPPDWTPPSALPIIPGAQGFGSDTVAGSGRHLSPPSTTVYRVTNLNDSGSGSLRACTEASGPRVCIFETSGTISLNSRLSISNPYITIAGQTAPSPGITLRGQSMTIGAHDVLVQHIRVRPGAAAGAVDAIGIQGGAYDVVVDHVSASWAGDEQISSYGAATHDATISNSILSEGMNYADHGYGSTNKYVTRIAHIRNLFAHHLRRSPRSGDTSVQVMDWMAINNVVYNWGDRGTDSVAPSSSFGKRLNIVGNVYKTGVNSDLAAAIVIDSPQASGTQIYAADNMRNGVAQSSPSDWSLIKGDTSVQVLSPPFPIGFTPMAASQVQTHVLANVGARPADRDPVGARIVDEVRNGTGQIINTETEVGGWPNLAVNTRTLALPTNPNGDADGDGYTNLEEWLHAYAASVEE